MSILSFGRTSIIHLGRHSVPDDRPSLVRPPQHNELIFFDEALHPRFQPATGGCLETHVRDVLPVFHGLGDRRRTAQTSRTAQKAKGKLFIAKIEPTTIGAVPFSFYLDKLSSRLGKAKALSALAHKLGRAFYRMLHKKEVFNIDQFLRH